MQHLARKLAIAGIVSSFWGSAFAQTPDPATMTPAGKDVRDLVGQLPAQVDVQHGGVDHVTPVQRLDRVAERRNGSDWHGARLGQGTGQILALKELVLDNQHTTAIQRGERRGGSGHDDTSLCPHA